MTTEPPPNLCPSYSQLRDRVAELESEQTATDYRALTEQLLDNLQQYIDHERRKLDQPKKGHD